MARLLDDAARRRVEVRVRQLRPDSERQWGRMTPHQAICHLNDSFKLALNERPVAAVAWPLKPVVRFIALQLPLPWAKGRHQDGARGGAGHRRHGAGRVRAGSRRSAGVDGQVLQRGG